MRVVHRLQAGEVDGGLDRQRITASQVGEVQGDVVVYAEVGDQRGGQAVVERGREDAGGGVEQDSLGGVQPVQQIIQRRRCRVARVFDQCERHPYALVDAIGAVGGADACWLSSGDGTTRSYLIQATAVSDLPAIAAAARRVLADDARVEVFASEAPLPKSHELTLRTATLLWSARPAPPIAVAPVFDGAGPEGGWFTGDHELITDLAERAGLLDFLTSGQIVLAARGRFTDVVTGAAAAVSANLRSDGRWVWSDATAYYLDRYGLAPDPGLVEHIRSARPGAGLTPLARYQVWAALLSLDEEESWPAR